jgi:hypothetical protein
MFAAGCVTRRQVDRLSAWLQSDQTQVNARLLDMMRRKSCAHYKKFLECLEETNQKHVAVLATEAASTYMNAFSPQYLADISCVLLFCFLTFTAHHISTIDLSARRNSFSSAFLIFYDSLQFDIAVLTHVSIYTLPYYFLDFFV